MKITNKGLYWGLILTFGLLYVLVAFVSTLHAIDFFKLSNNVSLAVLLGVSYELGQASVLFSILMTKNKEKFLPWLLMILLTGLQVTANVFASYKHMTIIGNEEWIYWYTSILKVFGVTGGNSETYQVIISWISGALLPVVALGMTALVAQNIKMVTEGESQDKSIDAKDIISEVSKIRPTESELAEIETILSKKKPGQNDDLGQKKEQLEKTKPETHEIMSYKDLYGDNNDNKEFEAHLNNEVSQLTTEIEPEVIPDKSNSIVDIKHNNGLIDIEIPPEKPKKPEIRTIPEGSESSSPEVKPDSIIKDLSPGAEEIIVEDDKRNKEKEEERLQRLREIARENLKKK